MTTREQRQAVNRANKRERDARAVIKSTKPERDPKYLDWIRGLPCVCCFASEYESLVSCGDDRRAAEEALAWLRYYAERHPHQQKTRTDPDHVGPRGMRQTCRDRQAIPVCREHHDERHSRLGKRFWQHHNIDRDELIKALNDAYDNIAD